MEFCKSANCVISIFCLFMTVVIMSCSDSNDISPLPEIIVKQDTNEISSGSAFDFGSAMLGTSKEAAFTIENSGTACLSLRGIPMISIIGSDDFTIVCEPSSFVDVFSSTVFSIKFTPSTSGEKTAIVAIESNDPDEAKYNFIISSSGERINEFIVTSNIVIYFTDPFDNSQMENALIERINSQSNEDVMDLCFYGLNREKVISAIENAIARGVRARFVGNIDGGNTVSSCEGAYYEGYNRIAQALDNAFPIEGRKRTNFPLDSGFDDFNLINHYGIMHNKFALFTDNNGNRYLYTGATNCTDTGFMRNNNNSLIICDDGIVKTYRDQFEFLLGLPDRIPISTVRRHIIDGITIDVLFAPNIMDGKTAMEHVTDLVSLARSSIHFMIFSFTHEDLINLFIDMTAGDLDLRGIFDESQLYNSSEEILARSGIPCRIDGNHWVENYFHGGKLHHKTMILDSFEDSAAVITGSFNWSNNANYNNNENLLFIYSKEIARIYEMEWQARWDEGTDVKTIERGDSAEYQEVVINEVMWMGSRMEYDKTVYSDEFIELKNMTDRRINLGSWTIQGAGKGGSSIVLNKCYIEPYGYLTLLGLSKSKSAFQPDLFVEDMKISVPNSELRLILLDIYGREIDFAGDGREGVKFAGFNGTGDGGLKKSMARKDDPGNGSDVSNWFVAGAQVNISNAYDYIEYNLATPGADNRSGDSGYYFPDVVISEIAWAGSEISHYDEWFELYNNTASDIDLKEWIIGGDLDVHLSGIIPAGGHFLLERTNDDSVPEKDADVIYTGGLNNLGGILKLVYNNREIDVVAMAGNWIAGSSKPRISMERIDVKLPGDAGNWQNGPGDVEGAQNSDE